MRVSRCLRVSAVVACFLWSGAAFANAADARLIGFEGEVQVFASDGTAKKSTLGMNLSVGDRIETGATGTVTILRTTGELVNLESKQKFVLGKADVSSAPGKGTSLASDLLEQISSFWVSDKERLENVENTVRAVEDKGFFVLTPRKGYLANRKPTVRWMNVPGASHYRVSLTSPKSGKKLLRRNVAAPVTSVPMRRAINEGERAFIRVQAFAGKKELISDEASFAIAERDVSSEIKRLSGELGKVIPKSTSGYNVLLVELYLRNKFYGEAYELLNQMRNQTGNSGWIDDRLREIRLHTELPQ